MCTPSHIRQPHANGSRLIDRHDSWFRPRVANEKYGDTYMLVGLNGTFLRTANAELINQIVVRKADFTKPVEGYKIVDIFGRSMLTQEGLEWRRHRKVVGPSFSEKSNKLVFEESLRQAESMMELWSSQGKNTEENMRVQNTAADAATLSLHVICAAGFGVPQLWPGESEEKLQGNVLPGFNTFQLSGDHTLPFKDSLSLLLKNILWLVAFPPWLLSRYFLPSKNEWLTQGTESSPFKTHQTTFRAFNECKRYFEELLEIKKKQLYLGESDKGTSKDTFRCLLINLLTDHPVDLMAPMIKASNEAPSDFDKESQTPNATLSKSEIIGNSFIFLFAGHETSANSIHFSIILLAIHLASQARLQADIDKIVGGKPTSELSYLTDMPRLYNSMVGAVMNEQLRLMPAILNVPKVTAGDQVVTIDGREFVVSHRTFIQLNVVATNRNPRYWPFSPSKRTGKATDLDDFVPERWLPSSTSSAPQSQNPETRTETKTEAADGLEEASYDTTSANSLFHPIKNSFISFSEGARACPGRRFAQVEITAVIAAIFKKYSVELDVGEWASDEEVARMGPAEKRAVYQKAAVRAEEVLQRCEQRTITLQMRSGDEVPVRFVERGGERFGGLFA